MKGKKILAGALSAAMVLAAMVVPAFADDDWGANTIKVTDPETSTATYYAKWSGAIEAVNKIATDETVTIECKENAEIESAGSHSPIKNSVKILGNNAKLKQDDLTIEQWDKGIINKDISVYIENLENAAVWGTRKTEYNVDITLDGCKGVRQVLVHGDIGTTNVKLNDCSFTNNDDTAVYLKTAGKTNISNCTFENIAKAAINIVKTTEGDQTVTIDNCEFTNCATAADSDYAAPIRLVNRTTVGSVDATVENCKISDTLAKNGDILLGDGRNDETSTPNVTLNTLQTKAEIQIQEPGKRAEAEKKNVTEEETATIEMPAVAKVNETKYTTLADAITAAQDGDTVTLLADAETSGFDHSKAITFDLNNNTLKFNEETVQNNVTADVGFKNGTIDISGIDITANAFWQVSGSGALNFENVNLYGDTFNSAFCVIYFVGTEAEASFVNSTVKLLNDGEDSGFIKGDNFMGKAVFDNTDITLTNTGRGFVTTDVTLKNSSDLTVSGTTDNGIENAFNRCALTVSDSNIDISGCTEYGIKLEKHDVEITGKSNVSVTDSGIADIAHADKTNPSGKVTVEENSTVTAENIGESVLSTATGDGKIISKADTISVKFKQTTNQNVYDIVLEGANLETINRLSTADFTFEFDVKDGKMAYAIAAKDGVTLTNPSENRYAFNFNGKDAADETGKEIVLGTVTFNGYGTFSFGVANADTNIVHAAKLADNIVDEFVVGGGEGKGTLDVVSASIDDVTLTVPTNKLTVNITFPNAIGSNAADYQKMKATIAGGDYSEEIALGETENGAYKIEKDLAENTPYTVTVSGEGYRTTRYTVTLNSDKILNFWNNAKDNAAEVEVGNPSSAKNVTFLAGDIVKDNEINIYDLSAVVSYFGMDNLVSAHPEYAKYDLNRDGKIDSKDVAYVLVSWGK